MGIWGWGGGHGCLSTRVVGTFSLRMRKFLNPCGSDMGARLLCLARAAGSAKSHEPWWFVYTLITKNELLFGSSLMRVALSNVEIHS